MPTKQQVEHIVDYITENVPGEPVRGEEIGDCVVRLLDEYRTAFSKIMRNLGKPRVSRSAPVREAFEIARQALGND